MALQISEARHLDISGWSWEVIKPLEAMFFFGLMTFRHHGGVFNLGAVSCQPWAGAADPRGLSSFAPENGCLEY